ncbi:MAG: NAD(P)-dependent oxidoreductase [Polyangiaceae bacterium]
MRVLVTGGTGFLGSHVVERLVADGHDVTCLVRKTSDTKFLRSLADRTGKVELRLGAVDAPETLPDAVHDADAVVHCAGLIKARSLGDFERVHKDGTVAVATAARDHAKNLKRFVHVSTAGVMGPSQPGSPHVESVEPNPTTPYSTSKLSGERALLAMKDELPIVVLRPPAIYGPRDDEVLAFFQMVRRTRMAFRMGSSSQSQSMIFVGDCVDAIVRAIDAAVPSGAMYLLDDGEVHTFEELATSIARAYGIRLLATPSIPSPLVYAAAWGSETFGRVTNRVMIFTRDKLPELLMEHFSIDSSAARRDLGWEPKTKFVDGARLTAGWYRENRWD